MPVSLDLRKAHAHRTHGDITAVLTWVNEERALVLLPHLRPGAPWYVVMEGAAYTWDDRDSRNVATVARKAMKACEVLGIEPSHRNAQRIAALVIDYLSDLVRMPSAPPADFYRGTFGRMQLNANGKPLAGEDIRFEKEGVSYA